VLKNGGEKFSCECEATIMKRMPVSAHKLGAGWAGPNCSRD